MDCANLAKKKRTIVTNCANCGKLIEKAPSAERSSKTGNLYCSKSCAASKNNSLFKKWENHPRFRTGIRSYRSIKLESVKELVCEQCGFDNVLALEVHHKDKNRKNNKLENLELLCCNCHSIRHKSENIV